VVALIRLWCLTVIVGLGTAQVALAGGPILQVTADGTSSVRPAWSPDGTRIAFQTSENNAYHVYVMAADGSNRRLISQLDNDDRHPAWSPDGSTLAVDSGTDLKREITLVDLGTSARTQITNLGGFASFPAWSPDGAKLSFYLYQNGVLDLWTVKNNGADPLQMTHALASEQKNQCTFACHAAAWSPDGSRLAYADGDQTHVYTMRSDDASDQVKVSADEPTGRSHFPEYLRDGRLAYVTEHIDPGMSWTDVWAVTPGSNQPPTQLLQGVQVQGPFEFSPDETQLLFASPRNGNFDIYVATLDAAGQAALKKVSAPTDLSPALAAVQPNSGSPSRQTTAMTAGETAAMTAGDTGATTAGEAFAIPSGPSPYLLALGGLAVIWLGVEGVALVRKRSKHTGSRRYGL
jgi:Tol biopolymer transport system component